MKLFLLLALAIAGEGRLARDTAPTEDRHLGGQGNNNGKTSLSEKFELFSIADADNCFDRASFCDAAYMYAYSYANDNDYGAAQASAYASFHRDVACEASSMALAETKAVLVMEGEFSMTRHGNHGAVTSADLATSLSHSQLAYVRNEAFVNNTANVDAYVSTSGYTNNLCRTSNHYYNYPYYYRQYLCAYASTSSRANATAYATSNSSSSSSALSGGDGEQTLGVHIEGKNLQSFHATVVAGASNFVEASAHAYANVFAEAFLNAYANAYARVCTYYQRRYRYSSYWSTYSSYCPNASGNAGVAPNRALGEAFADRVATAAANTQYTALIHAEFVNEPGNDDTFTLLHNGFASASAIPHCSAN